ncbi:conserved Plasmodium protein, unknown function [Plasmodium sp. DRC-Itaito]|nr:conserved Plasmodium protein, unknown function [Plasmodium sp. DRC-Itaito]
MSDNIMNGDTLSEYRKMHKKNYVERIIKENELIEKQKTEELLNEKKKNEEIYRQLQIDKDREYSKQCYYEINNFQNIHERTYNDSDIRDNYTQRLIYPSANSYIDNNMTQNLLDGDTGYTFSQRIRRFFLNNNIRQCFVCTTVQLICNLVLIILLIAFIIIFGLS